MGQTMKNNFKKSKGFTLIELIIVIIILGILAVTVAPKFIDVSGDARGVVMEGVVASIESANTLVHAKALITGDDSITVDGETITIANGYPEIASLPNLLDFDTTSSAATITFDSTAGTFTHTTAPDSTACIITVTAATSAAKPNVTLVKTGC